MRAERREEPNMETALGWWSELPAKWTPFGWRDHLFRFNVLFNGMISAIPDTNRRSQAWRGQGVQVGVWPSMKAEFPRHVSEPHDNGEVVQSWRDCETPVLCSEWAQEGLLLRQEVFAHVLGGKAIETGIEPLFAWIRLYIHDTLPALPVPDKYGFNLKINAPYISVGAMSSRYNIAVQPELSAYPRRLSAVGSADDRAGGSTVVEPDGSARFGVASGQDCSIQVLPNFPTERDFLLFLELDARKGAHVDLLLPMLPAEEVVYQQEVSLGFERALEEAEEFWREKPITAAEFCTPEYHINKTIRHNLQLSEIIAERDPATERHSMLTGSWAYADQWATPACMNYVMLLDTMGYHHVVEKYMRAYVEEQGTVKPQSGWPASHPGVLAAPTEVAAINWTSDHGAILWALAEHLLLTGGEQLAHQWTPAIVKACDFIRDARRTTGHAGVAGVMPPGVATDMPTQIQSVWADAWACKGLSTAVRWLTRVGHPRAAEFDAEATDYRESFVTALRAKARGMPAWKDEDGKEHRLVPMALYGEQSFEYRNAFFLDTGPLVLVFSGLLDADDELMESALLWFREGPPRRIYRYDSDCWQVPSLHHEMSTCEPCYSWNVFHSHRSADRQRFLEAMYSLFAGSVSRQTYTVCETRGGVTGLTAATLPVYLARLAVVDDQIQEGELHLLRLMPLAWLRGDRGSIFDDLPTEFGPVSTRVQLLSEVKELKVEFRPNFRTHPARIILHIPPVDGLQSVTVNGAQIDWESSQQTIEIR